MKKDNSDNLKEDRYIERIVERHSAMIYRLALSYTAKNADAEDIMQEVFLRYIRKGASFESEEHERAWFIRVTLNCSKSYLTSAWKKKVVSLSDVKFDNEKSESFLVEGEGGGILCAIKDLPSAQRLCIHLFYYEDFSVKEIAKISGMKESTVKSHLFRARAALKEKLKGEYSSV